jgi:hypothetical protein
MGMSLISPAAGLAALEGVLAASASSAAAGSSPVISAIPFKWQKMLQRLGKPVPQFFEEWAAAEAPSQPRNTSRRQRQRTAVKAAAAHPQLVLKQVLDSITSILGHEVGLLVCLSAVGIAAYACSNDTRLSNDVAGCFAAFCCSSAICFAL